jgi:hypothetical protein
MENGKTPMFGGSFPFTIYHFPFRPAFFSGLLDREPSEILTRERERESFFSPFSSSPVFV